jgi:hypothetical protein
VAYTLIDIDGVVPEQAISQIRGIDGVLAVRAIK